LSAIHQPKGKAPRAPKRGKAAVRTSTVAKGKLRTKALVGEVSGLDLLTVAGRKKETLRPGLFGKIYRASPIERVDIIKAGVAPGTVGDIADAMGAPREVLIRNLGIPKSTWARKQSQQIPLERNASEKVMGLATLIGQVETLVSEQGRPESFDAAKWFHEWIEEPVPALGGRKPAELLDTKEGQQIVSGLLDAIRAGTYL
jgi:putative toxin-antitoxin system antitoxin component (TIGR02293 family)